MKRVDRLYKVLDRLEHARSYQKVWPELDLPRLNRDLEQLGEELRELGPVQRRTVHDLRGGTIFGLLVLPLDVLETVVEFHELSSLARDHAKFMRSIFPTLDPERSRREEEAIQVHTVDSFLEAWRGRVVFQNQRPVRVKVGNDFHGAITSCCVEASAIERVLVNLTNNAARFAVGPDVWLRVVGINDSLTRWCVLNEVPEEQLEWLRGRMGNNGLELFQAGVTRGGEGLGLGSCAEVVSRVLGVPNIQQLIESGFMGAGLLDRYFCCWFHWPTYSPGPEDRICACGH